MNFAVKTMDRVIGRRVGKDEHADERPNKRPVHHSASAVAVGKNPSQDAKQTRRQGEGDGNRCRRPDIEPIDRDQIARQPNRERDVAAECEEIIEPETPDPQTAQRLDLSRE